MTLFDPDDYTARGRTPKQRRQTRPLAQRAIVPSHGWVLVATLAGPMPELHRLSTDPQVTYENELHGRVVTVCDVMGRLVAEIPPGTVAVLCAVCAR